MLLAKEAGFATRRLSQVVLYCCDSRWQYPLCRVEQVVEPIIIVKGAQVLRYNVISNAFRTVGGSFRKVPA